MSVAESEHGEDYADIAHKQRLKAAVHYHVNAVCEFFGEDMGVVFSKQVISLITDATFRFTQSTARDLELFANHARRTTVNTDDVKMTARRNIELTEHINKTVQKLQRDNDKGKSTKRRTKSVKHKGKDSTDCMDVTEDTT